MDNLTKMVTALNSKRWEEAAVTLASLAMSRNTYSRHSHRATRFRSLASYCVLDSYASVSFCKATDSSLIVLGASIRSSKYNFPDYFSISSGHRLLEVACDFS